MVAINLGLGFLEPNFTPTKTGRAFELTRYLKLVKDFRDQFKPYRTDYDWLSRDPVEVDKYVDDPLCGFMISTQSWVGLLDALPTLTSRENLAAIPKQKPIYVFAGSCDPVGEMGVGVLRLVDDYRAAWLNDVEVKLYPGGRHEMLNETNRAEVLSDCVAWIDGAIAT